MLGLVGLSGAGCCSARAALAGRGCPSACSQSAQSTQPLAATPRTDADKQVTEKPVTETPSPLLVRPDRIVAIRAEAEAEPTALERHVEVGAYTDAEWDRVGFYDETGRYEHAYAGEKSGHFDYAFEGPPKRIRQVVVTARLSAESGDVGAPDELSDVTLFLNDVEVGTQTVPRDDGQGALHTWVVDDPALLAQVSLKGGKENRLRFEIKKDAANQHGMCIYGRAIDAFSSEQGSPLTIRFTPADDAVVTREKGSGT